jgi:Protein of unknown function (DUF3617)
MPARTALAFLAIILAGPVQSEALLEDGAYEVRVHLELPNVLSWSATRSTTTICLPYENENRAPFPVLSRNNPLATCPARNLQQDGATLRFDILCEGRGAAWASAVYELMPAAFEGRIAMVMGGKNMTMTEVQSGRRVGGCDAPGAPPNALTAPRAGRSPRSRRP